MPGKTVLAKGMVEKIGEETSRLIHAVSGKKHRFEAALPDHKEGIRLIAEKLIDKTIGVLKNIVDISAVGHRVVHGGDRYSQSVLIDEAVIDRIEAFTDLAPLHNPPNLTGIKEAMAAMPGVPMVAVFDTAFHQTLPKRSYLYALPFELYGKYRIRRYGFHGSSHAYVTKRAAELLGKPANQVNLITCHLGNGCSMTAVENGASVDTTMGLTPLEGLAMGTRCGDLDPAIIFYLLRKGEYGDHDAIDSLLNKQSGLLGISGISNDQRNLIEDAAAKGNDSRSQLALDIFDYRVKKYIGAYMAVLGNVDAVVFTGGVGENSHLTRNGSCSGLENYGIEIDPDKNRDIVGGKEGDISTANSTIRVLVVPTDEEGWIASDTYRLCKNL